MRDTVTDFSIDLFFKISGANENDLDIFFQEEQKFPSISLYPRITVVIPLPRELQSKHQFLGHIFENYEQSYETIWMLYLTCVCHMAANVKVCKNVNLQNWKKNNLLESKFKTINFIHNILAENHLKNNFPEYWESIKNVKEYFEKSELSEKNKKSRFAKKYCLDKDMQEYTNDILYAKDSQEKLVEIAEVIYKNQEILALSSLPYQNHFNIQPKKYQVDKINIKPKGDFKKLSDLCDELWLDEKTRINRMNKKFAKISSDLNFDKIKLCEQNFNEYLRLKNESSLFLKKLRNQLKMVSNIVDEPNPEDLGMVEMQRAIQAMASENPSIQIFEQDTARRTDENWAIIMDTSASMKIKFDDMKKFALCLSETADELNSRGGQWGLFCFNNEFLVVKDHSEKYTQSTKARIGGITNEGLSFIPDAITLASRILQNDPSDKKFIFVITDGQTLGTENETLENAVAQARKRGINVIGIGLPEGLSKIFTISLPKEELKKTVSRFVDAYVEIAHSNM